MASALYSDTPLSSPTTQIRLLRLEERSDDAGIAGYLEVYDFNKDCPQYIAISYTWGDDIPTFPIEINNYTLPSRFNCWHALWQTRRAFPGLFLWIDSICIDQNRNDEKNAQVAMMGEIYQRSLMVASCIGIGDTIARLKAAVKKEHKPQIVHCLNELDYCPYFDRLWVKQEVMLAADGRLLCGMDSMDWGELYGILLSANTEKNVADTDSGDFSGSRTFALFEHRKMRRDGSHTSLFETLVRYGDSRCSDPRDKVYGLLPLLPKESWERRGIPVNYSQSRFQFFRNISAVLCEGYQNASYKVFIILDRLLEWLELKANIHEVSSYLLPNETFRPKSQPVLRSEFSNVKLPVISQTRLYTAAELTNTDILRLPGDSVAFLTDGVSLQFLTPKLKASTLHPNQFSRTFKIAIRAGQYTFSGLHHKRVYHAMLVQSEIQTGDLLAEVLLNTSLETFYAVLKCHRGSGPRLHSWAIPVKLSSTGFRYRGHTITLRDAQSISSSFEICEPSTRIIFNRGTDAAPLGESTEQSCLSLSHEDIMTFALLNREPIRALSCTISTNARVSLVR